MRPATMTTQGTDTARLERMRVPDFLRLIEELKSLKSRSLNQDLARMEEQYQAEIGKVTKEAERRSRAGDPTEVTRRVAEERRIMDSRYAQEKEILTSKYQKMDAHLLALTQFLQGLGPIKELEVRLAAQEEKVRKQEEELNVQRKVMAHEQEELEHEKQLLHAAEDQLRAKTREVDSKLANLDVAKRAKELGQAQAEFETKMKSYQGEMAVLARERDQLNKDFENQGLKRAELDRQTEALAKERAHLAQAKAKAADVVARELATAFESFVRDLLRPEPKDGGKEEAPPAKVPEKAVKPEEDIFST